jgi:hypothetical protein
MINCGYPSGAWLAAVCLAAGTGLIAAGVGGDRAATQDVSIESIRGIEGIDTITLQNLEAVLRMQQRPEEPRPQGGASTVAALMSLPTTEQDDRERQPDTREDMALELEGS